LLNKEIEIIGAKNVVLMGLSQGCASSLVSTLLWEGEPFRAVVGMCGYLPFRKGMADTLVDQGQEEDPFARSDDEDGVDMFERGGDIPGPEETNFEKAIGWLREELQIEKEQEKHTEPPRVPVFMGHGSEDEKVPVALGKLAAELLGDVGMCVEWKEYDGLGHWYSEHMLKDVIAFLMGLEGGGSNVDGNKVTWGI
jgi:predicted esterase